MKRRGFFGSIAAAIGAVAALPLARVASAAPACDTLVDTTANAGWELPADALKSASLGQELTITSAYAGFAQEAYEQAQSSILAINADCGIPPTAWVEPGGWRDYGNLQDVFLRTAPSAHWKPHSYRVMVITKERLKSRETVLHQHWRSVDGIAPGAIICLHTMRAGETLVGAHIETVS